MKKRDATLLIIGMGIIVMGQIVIMFNIADKLVAGSSNDSNVNYNHPVYIEYMDEKYQLKRSDYTYYRLVKLPK